MHTFAMKSRPAPAFRPVAPAHARSFRRTPAVRQILQGTRTEAKLRIGVVKDPAETVADRLANRVMHMTEPRAEVRNSRRSPLAGSASSANTVQRTCTECEDELNHASAHETIRPQVADEGENVFAGVETPNTGEQVARKDEAEGDSPSLCLKSIFGGEVMFSDLPRAVLDNVAVINEDDGAGLTTPVENDVWYDCDGFWYRPVSQWFKVPDHCRAEITSLDGSRVAYEHCCNLVASILKDGPGWSSADLDDSKQNPFSSSGSK